jgi:AcrR family transcriptional regulator
MPKPAKKQSANTRGDRKQTFTEQARRKQILQAASELFRSQGFTNTSLDDIAKAVGVSRGVLFYYFDGKREIGEHTVRQTLRGYSDYVRERVSRRRSPRNRLLEFVDACLDYQQAHPEVYIEYVELIGCLGDDDDKYRLNKAVNKRTREMLVELIESGQADGDIAGLPARELADVLQAFIDGMMEMTAMEPGAVDLEASKKLIRRMLLAVIEA